MCRLTYAQIRKMAENAEWAVLANWNDCPELAVKYQKVATRLRNALWNFPAENIERSYVALGKGRELVEQSKALLK